MKRDVNVLMCSVCDAAVKRDVNVMCSVCDAAVKRDVNVLMCGVCDAAVKRDVNVLMCGVCDAGQRCRHPWRRSGEEMGGGRHRGGAQG